MNKKKVTLQILESGCGHKVVKIGKTKNSLETYFSVTQVMHIFKVKRNALIALESEGSLTPVISESNGLRYYSKGAILYFLKNIKRKNQTIKEDNISRALAFFHKN
nr:hypothetical protein [uncultured Draconibacterium sp.]